MRGHRPARPDRASLACDIVADSKDEIEDRRPGPGKFLPRFAVQLRRCEPQALEEIARHRMDLVDRVAAGAVGFEPACTYIVEDGFSHDATCRIRRAQEQDVVGTIIHRSSPIRTAGNRLPGSLLGWP